MDSDAEVAAARIGRTVGSRWRLESVLGIGGMAAVYQARDPNGTIAAVKILHPEMSARVEVRERFLREGYAANKIGHPGVVQALEHGDRDTDVFLAMELLEGETLRSRVKRHGRLPIGEVLDYAEQILDVLVAAHAQNVVHRDLKPDNLFVTTHGRIKVLDFGLARLLDSVPGQHRTRTGVALGTLAYMAPEQALGRRAEIDGRVDLFALGATLFRILAGRRVHEAESEAELLMAMASRPAPPLATVAPDIPRAVTTMVDLALAFSRDARYPDARTMLSDVRALRAGGPPPYATARLSSRDEATRADGPAMSQRTQPLEAQRGTVPLAAYPPPSAPTPPVGFPPQEPPPISIRPPASHPGQSPNSLQGYAQPTAVARTAYGATVPASTEPLAAAAAATATPAKRSSLGLILVLGGLFVVGAGGLLAVFLFARSSGDLGSVLGPQGISGAPIASATQAGAARAATVPATAPAATAGSEAPAATAALAAADPGTARALKPDPKRTAAAKPGTDASRPAPSASAAPAPTQSAAPAPAPSPAPAPAPAPAPSPNVEPSPAPSPSASGTAQGKVETGSRRGQGRRKAPR